MHWKVDMLILEEMNGPVLLDLVVVGRNKTSHPCWPLKDGLQEEAGHLLADAAESGEASPAFSSTSELRAQTATASSPTPSIFPGKAFSQLFTTQKAVFLETLSKKPIASSITKNAFVIKTDMILCLETYI